MNKTHSVSFFSNRSNRITRSGSGYNSSITKAEKLSTSDIYGRSNPQPRLVTAAGHFNTNRDLQFDDSKISGEMTVELFSHTPSRPQVHSHSFSVDATQEPTTLYQQPAASYNTLFVDENRHKNKQLLVSASVKVIEQAYGTLDKPSSVTGE